MALRNDGDQPVVLIDVLPPEETISEGGTDPVVIPPTDPPTDSGTSPLPPAEVQQLTLAAAEQFDSVPPTTNLSDIDTQLSNILFSFPNCRQGWKAFCQISWTSGVLTQFSYTFNDLTPMNPLISQGNTK